MVPLRQGFNVSFKQTSTDIGGLFFGSQRSKAFLVGVISLFLSCCGPASGTTNQAYSANGSAKCKAARVEAQLIATQGFSSVIAAASTGDSSSTAMNDFLAKYQTVMNKIADCAPHPSACRTAVSTYVADLKKMTTDFLHTDTSALSTEIISTSTACGLK